MELSSLIVPFRNLIIGTPATWTCLLSGSNANLDGSEPIVDLVRAGENGARVDFLRVIARGMTTAGMVRLFVSEGNDYRLLDEIAVSAVTPNATVPAFKADWILSTETPLLLRPGAKLAASTHNAEKISLVAIGMIPVGPLIVPVP